MPQMRICSKNISYMRSYIASLILKQINASKIQERFPAFSAKGERIAKIQMIEKEIDILADKLTLATKISTDQMEKETQAKIK